MNAASAAREILSEIADDSVLTVADELVAEGTVRWEFDRSHEGVIGLVEIESPSVAWVIVYVDPRDFEMNAEFEEMTA